MMPLALLAALVLIPVLLSLILRVNAVLVVLSVLIGGMFVQFIGDDASLVMRMFSKAPQVPMITNLVLLMAPLALSFLFAKRSLPSSKVMLHLLPLIIAGLILAILTMPILPGALQSEVFATQPGGILRKAQDNIVGGGLLIVLTVVWVSHRSKHSEHGKKHGH